MIILKWLKINFIDSFHIFLGLYTAGCFIHNWHSLLLSPRSVGSFGRKPNGKQIYSTYLCVASIVWLGVTISSCCSLNIDLPKQACETIDF